jgi:YVTN family beta-propeller protein
MPSAADLGVAPVSRSIQISADGASLWVVNTESDSISQIDVASRTLSREISLAAGPPTVGDGGRYDPAVRPRALALVDSLGKAYVAGQAANQIVVVDTQAGKVLTSIPVGAEPVAAVASSDGKAVYVVSHEAAIVTQIDPQTDSVVRTVSLAASPFFGEHPWGASLRADGSLLYVTQFLRNPAVFVIQTSDLSIAAMTLLPDQPPSDAGNILIPNGQVRGLYAVVPRPNTGELWVPHLLLATGTPQPELDFDSTVFATFTLLSPGGSQVDTRLLFQSESLAGIVPGAFADVISGPRDIAFTPDGALALVANAQSEDVMVFDAQAQVEVGLVRPTPSTLIEGIAVDSSGTHAYLQGRNSHNVTVLDIFGAQSVADGGMAAAVDGDPIEALAGPDPMPADYRHGQRLFYTSNSAAYPVTQNFWVACSSCHLEGQTDAVTWHFLQGPRDTPSNAGGPINTGFLFRQAVRNSVIDYDQTIRIEQGGFYNRTDPTQQADLQALADFTNFAIPFPQNPNLSPDGGLTIAQANGKALFGTHCAGCHAGDFFTDSGKDNPTLDVSGPVELHDMTDFTCVTTGPFPDMPSTDIDGNYRSPCDFDTPTLRGIFASAPYLHDGSAATLDEAVAVMAEVAITAGSLSATDQANLVAYLQTL